MPKSSKKSTKKRPSVAKKAAKKVKVVKAAKPKKVAPAKKAKPVKKAVQTLVWKRSKAGRPKKAGAAKKTARRKGPKVVASKEVEKHELQEVTASQIEEQNKSELKATESKFQLGPKKNAGDFHAHNIPFDYGKNRIILLVVDPQFAFVYWEVQNDKMLDALNAVGSNAKLTLRFRDMDSAYVWDISIYERVSNWYLKLDHPEKNLMVEIGMKNDRGDFFMIAQSNPMKLPRMGLARPGPIKWMLVSPTGEMVITEIEEYTDADLELLKKILGPYFFDLFRRGKFSAVTGSSAENIFMSLEEIQPPSLSS